MPFLSFRVATATRDRVKLVAARRGESLQAVMGRAVDRLLAEEDRRRPTLSHILRRLRSRQAELRKRGIVRLWLFGSIVRGDARPESDVDLLVEFNPAASVSLTAFARLREDLSAILAAPVDLAEWRTLRPHVRAAAEREAVNVF
ncbi:MAG: nucleotidyltransferase family protein [Alphaproteobacteria bacterium]